MINLPMQISTERRFNHSIAIRKEPLYFSLRIGKKFQRIKLEGRSFRSIEYKGSADWEIYPTSPWNYGLILDPNNPEEDIIKNFYPLQKYPFADTGDVVPINKE